MCFGDKDVNRNNGRICVESGLLFWAVALFICLIFAVTLEKEAIAVSSTYGNRELNEELEDMLIES